MSDAETEQRLVAIAFQRDAELDDYWRRNHANPPANANDPQHISELADEVRRLRKSLTACESVYETHTNRLRSKLVRISTAFAALRAAYYAEGNVGGEVPSQLVDDLGEAIAGDPKT